MIAGLAVLGALTDCAGPAARPPEDSDKNTATSIPAPTLVVSPARRCGECHESHLSEWAGSAHANSDRSPVYQAMRSDAPDADACDRCHAPLAAVLGRSDPLASEGVNCEVCHAIAAVELSPTRARWSLQLASNHKYGPLCDADPPYFHRTACSPLHSESRLCAACHHLGEPLPVFSEYAEWQHGDAPSSGLECQSCHMSKRTGPVASGGPGQRAVSRHDRGPQPGDALVLTAAALVTTLGLELRGELRVSGAAHRLPVGLPGRELALVADLLDETGKITGSAELVYSKVLVDALGREVPFYAATRVASDSRLEPGAARSFVLRLPAAPARGVAVLRLLDRPLSPALSAALTLHLPARTLEELRFSGPWESAP